MTELDSTEEYGSLMDNIKDLIKLAVSLKPSELGFLKIFQIEDLFSYFPLQGRYPSSCQPRMKWFMNPFLMECIRRNVQVGDHLKRIGEESEVPCLIIPYLSDGQTSKRSEEKSIPSPIKNIQGVAYPWWATQESYFVERRESYVGMIDTLTLTSDKTPQAPRTAGGFTYALNAPQYVSVCFTSLGEENTEEMCLNTHHRQHVFKTKCTEVQPLVSFVDTTESFISNWMSKSAIFHHHLGLVKNVYFEHYYNRH